MPDPHSVACMREIDRMSPAFRALVHEFGFAIVAAMMNDGYDDAGKLRTILEGWRERRQDQLIKTDYAIARKVFHE